MSRLKKLRKYTDAALRKAIDDPDELKKAQEWWDGIIGNESWHIIERSWIYVL